MSDVMIKPWFWKHQTVRCICAKGPCRNRPVASC
jgi:hypothetical protein